MAMPRLPTNPSDNSRSAVACKQQVAYVETEAEGLSFVATGPS